MSAALAKLVGRKGLPDRLLAEVWAQATGENAESTRKRLAGEISHDLSPCLKTVTVELSASSQRRKRGESTASFCLVKPDEVLQFHCKQRPEFASFFGALLEDAGQKSCRYGSSSTMTK